MSNTMNGMFGIDRHVEMQVDGNYCLIFLGRAAPSPGGLRPCRALAI